MEGRREREKGKRSWKAIECDVKWRRICPYFFDNSRRKAERQTPELFPPFIPPQRGKKLHKKR